MSMTDLRPDADRHAPVRRGGALPDTAAERERIARQRRERRARAQRDLAAAAVVLLVVLAATGSLTRVFVTSTWVGDTVAAALVAVAIAAGVRALRFGPGFAAGASLVGLIVFTYVVHLPAGGLLPGTEQWNQFTGLLDDGLRQFRDEPAPTAPLDGLMVLVTTGVWLVAHMVHEIVVRLRRPGLGLVPAVVLWAVPLAVPLPPGRTWPQTLPLLLAASLLLLLESDADVSSAVRDRLGPRIPPVGVGVAVVAALGAALFPAINPWYGDDPWYDLTAGGGPRGYQPIVDVGDRLKLPIERDVLEYTSNRRVYLRLAALDTFDGTTWRVGPASVAPFRPDPEDIVSADGDLPAETAIASGARVDLDVTILDLQNIYVPVPYQPIRVSGDAAGSMIYSRIGGFLATTDTEEYDGTLTTGVVPGTRYSVEAVVPTPSPEALQAISPPPEQVTAWTQLPGAYDDFARLAEEIYAEAGATTNLEKALAVQDFFIGPDSEFVYSTDTQVLRGSGALKQFVFDEKAGYCEYYSTAMAVMLRATGVPARVAVGFLGGRVVERADPESGEAVDRFRVSTSDAHAWVEVLFPGEGWIRFEPTPRADGATMVPTAGDLDPLQTQAEIDRGEVPNPFEGLEDNPVEDDIPTASDLPTPGAETPATGGTEGEASTPWPIVALGLLGLAGVGLVVASRRVTGPGAGADAVEAVLTAQRHVLTHARRLGLERRSSETVPVLLERWIADGRVDAATGRRFARVSQAAAFGGVITDEMAAMAGRDAMTLVAGLGESVSARDRTIAPVRVPLDRAAQAVGRVRDLVRR